MSPKITPARIRAARVAFTAMLLGGTTLAAISHGAQAQTALDTTAPAASATGPTVAPVSKTPSSRVNVALPRPPAYNQPVPDYVSSVPPLPQPPSLFGSIAPMQYLRDHGVAILLDNVNEFSGIISGPRKGSSNAGQYGLETDIDWERLAGLTGFSTHSVAVGRYGIPASRMFGDNINPSSEIYGAGGNVVYHQVFFYGQETLAHGRVDIAAGRMSFLSDYSASPLYCNFQNNAFCGNPKASSDNTAHSSYPDANWATRWRVRPTHNTYVSTGIYFDESNIYQANNGYRSGLKFNGAKIIGETFPIEAGWEPLFGPDQLPGHYKIGFAYDDINHADNLRDINGDYWVLSGLGRRQRKGAAAEWALADQMLVRHGPGQDNGLVVFGGFYHNSKRSSVRNYQFEAGAIDRGFWKARPGDAIAVAFSYTKVSGDLIRTEELQEELGLPITGVGNFYNNAAPTGVQSHTMNFEANYQIQVYRGVSFQPSFQYYIRPNAQKGLPDAALLGFKSHIEFF